MKDSFRGVTTFSIKKLDRDLRDNLDSGIEKSRWLKEKFLRIIWVFEERFGHALAEMKRG